MKSAMRTIDHAEELVCYGDGFETLPRNKAVLVKTGRGDDIDALTVAKNVVEKNRKRYKQDHKTAGAYKYRGKR